MSDPKMRLVLPEAPSASPKARRPLGRLLADRGLIKTSDVLFALGEQRMGEAQLGDWLIAQGLISETALYAVLAEQHGAEFLSAARTPAQLHLQTGMDGQDCLNALYVPWHKIGNATVIATSQPDDFETLRARLPAHLHPVIMAIACPSAIEDAVRAHHTNALVQRAENRVPEDLSCRALPAQLKTLLSVLLPCLMLALGLQWISPASLYDAVFAFAVIMVLTGMALKSVAAALTFVAPKAAPKPAPLHAQKLPRISVLIPLHDENDILHALLHRIGLLDYPRALLDVIVIVEADDEDTITHLENAQFPPWIRMLKVPPGNITTKPRAMNYALPFCRGSIVGIYDAEDAPEPDQLKEVAAAFAASDAKTGCIQAVLDYYNARSNALARFFAIEYATWFRLVLPGVARMGFAIPLGGTSVFFRREVIEELHGWDAHNVTEDADLGIRLARAGYHTKLIQSVTLEEANNAPWAWIKQRSRWLKGYLITYLTHMRRPLRLMFELGAWKFFGFQAFFLSSISQYMLAPLIWSCMIFYFGAPQWMGQTLAAAHISTLITLFICMWCLSTAINILAVSGKYHRHLIPWTLGMTPYLALGTLAIYKGAWELITRPFYWEKTAHGHSELAQGPAAAAQPPEASTEPASSFNRVTNATEM